MTWITLDELSCGPVGRNEWETRLRAGEAESYTDPHGERWVWIEPGAPVFDPRKLNGRLQRLQRELAGLHEERRLAASTPTASAPAPAPAPTPTPARAPKAEASEPLPRAERLLAEIQRRWTGSERELERDAGLPKAFLAKAKKGERRGARSRSSWDRLERFLQARAA